MKRSNKRDIAISCSVLALGCFLMAAGWGMGGGLNVGRDINVGGVNGIHVGSRGLFVGGINGLYLGPLGISVGGPNGLYIGPAGIRVGSLGGAYVETGMEDVLMQEAWSVSGTEGWNTIVSEGVGESFQNIEVEAFDRIYANVDLGDITVVQEGSGYFVAFKNNVESYGLNYSFDGSTLVIGSEGGSWKAWGGNNAGVQVTIVIPEGAELKGVELFSNLGDLVVGELEHTLPRADLKTSLGDVTWENSTVKELNAISSLGNVTVILPDLKKVGYEVSTNLGEVIVENQVIEREQASRQPRDKESFIWAHSDLGDIYLGCG